MADADDGRRGDRAHDRQPDRLLQTQVPVIEVTQDRREDDMDRRGVERCDGEAFPHGRLMLPFSESVTIGKFPGTIPSVGLVRLGVPEQNSLRRYRHGLDKANP